MDVMHESKRVAPPAGNQEVTLLICLYRQVFDFPRNRETAGSLWGPRVALARVPVQAGWFVRTDAYFSQLWSLEFQGQGAGSGL